MTRYTETESPINLAEQERIAWADGDTEKAALLARLCDDADELTRLLRNLRRHRERRRSAGRVNILDAQPG